ncbi:hypothetical protein [Glutamicibacter sp.]|jgi:hypothetical protein|uniref:hypothetical protein n=1 Tax=Glutamicibacter sp. TaxID=1931995 RepID=UPI002FD8D776
MDGYLLPGFPANICLLDTLHIARQMLDGGIRRSLGAVLGVGVCFGYIPYYE